MENVILKEKTLVLVGLWNVAILTPDWFKNIFPDIVKEKEIPMQVLMGSNSEFKFTINNVDITITSSRIILSVKEDSFEHNKIITKFAEGIADELHHTPISAIGHNILYQLENKNYILFEDEIVSKYKKLCDETLNPGLVNSQKITHSVAFENFILNLTYTRKVSNDTKDLFFNYHYEIKDKSKIQTFLSEFENNILNSNNLIKKLVN